MELIIFIFLIRAVRIGTIRGKSELRQASIRQKILKYRDISGDSGDAFAMIDPCVFVDDDGQAYFYYGGGGRCIGARLKDNMVELAEKPRKMEGLSDFHEAAWVHKRNGTYYLSYSDNVPHPNGNRMHYATE